MRRKTYEVETVKVKCNKALSDPATNATQLEMLGPEGARAYRQGVTAVLETVLMGSGNYRGFAYKDGKLGEIDDTIRSYI